jgi:hypothetical protein
MNVVARTRRCIFVVSAFLPDRDNATTKANLLHHGVADTLVSMARRAAGWMTGGAGILETWGRHAMTSKES